MNIFDLLSPSDALQPADRQRLSELTAVRAIEQYMLRVPPKALFPDANWIFGPRPLEASLTGLSASIGEV
jgi:hypothetical protein